MACGNRSCRTAGRSAWTKLSIVWITRVRRVHKSKFGSYRFAHYHGTRFFEFLNDGCILLSLSALVNGAAVFSGQFRCIYNVFKTNRYALQFSYGAAMSALLICLFGGRYCLFAIQMLPSLDS